MNRLFGGLIAAIGLVCASALSLSPAAAQSRSGNFDFYVLALSWSPSFCALEGREKGRDQCDGPAKGFVLHGLWPQYERGFPSACEHPFRNAPNSVIQSIRGLYPEDGLARHQWRKHGTCSGLTPAAYFNEVRRAVEKVNIPERLDEAKDGGRVRTREIEAAFIEANKGLRPGMLAATCVRGMLQEVRVCMTQGPARVPGLSGRRARGMPGAGSQRADALERRAS